MFRCYDAAENHAVTVDLYYTKDKRIYLPYINTIYLVIILNLVTMFFNEINCKHKAHNYLLGILKLKVAGMVSRANTFHEGDVAQADFCCCHVTIP